MGGFIIKSTKRYKKSWEKAQFSLRKPSETEGKETEFELVDQEENGDNDSDEDETIYESEEDQDEEEIEMNK